MKVTFTLLCILLTGPTIVSAQNSGHRSTPTDRPPGTNSGRDHVDTGPTEGAGDGEEDERNDDNDDNDVDNGVEGGGDGVRVNPMDALIRLQAVRSVDDFVSLLQTEDGRQMTSNDFFSEYLSEDGNRVVHTGARMAVPDGCSPRLTTVRLVVNSSDPSEISFPRCTRVERCGGCCPTPHLQCVPASTERISLTVVKARAVRPASSHLVYQGLAPVVLERHTRCTVRCALTQEACGPTKQFLADQCVCTCRRYIRCRSPKVFNAHTCRCECRAGERPCCAPRAIQCGLTFNRSTCSCQAGGEHVHANNGTSGPVVTNTELYLQVRQGGASSPLPFGLEENAAATPTAIVGTEVDLTDVCVNISCPGTFRTVIIDGNCRCRPLGPQRPRPRAQLCSQRPQSTSGTPTTGPEVDMPSICPNLSCPRSFRKVVIGGNCRCRPRPRPRPQPCP